MAPVPKARAVMKMNEKVGCGTLLLLAIVFGCVMTYVTREVGVERAAHPVVKSACELAQDRAAGICYRAKQVGEALSMTSTVGEFNESRKLNLQCDLATAVAAVTCQPAQAPPDPSKQKPSKPKPPKPSTPEQRCAAALKTEEEWCRQHWDNAKCNAAADARVAACNGAGGVE
jgi:hypothetical protein